MNWRAAQNVRNNSLYQVNQLFTGVRKEFLHVLRDKRTLLILFGMPVVQILLFGFALSTEVKDTRIAVLDQDKSQSST